jgi:hypothetical protein
MLCTASHKPLPTVDRIEIIFQQPFNFYSPSAQFSFELHLQHTTIHRDGNETLWPETLHFLFETRRRRSSQFYKTETLEHTVSRPRLHPVITSQFIIFQDVVEYNRQLLVILFLSISESDIHLWYFAPPVSARIKVKV